MEEKYFEIALYRYQRSLITNKKGLVFRIEDAALWVEKFADPTVLNSSLKYFQSALRSLEEAKLVSHIPDRFAGDFYLFESDLGTFQTWLRANNQPYAAYERLQAAGVEWLRNALRAIEEETSRASVEVKTGSAPTGEVGAATEKWEPLPLNISDPRVQEAIEGAKDALESIRADNGFAATYPGERDNIVSHVEATITSVSSGKVTRHQIQEHFVAAGKWLMDKFGGTAIGTIGGELVKWGLRLLGLIP